MKRVLTLTLFLTLYASAAFADQIGVFADRWNTTCSLSSVARPPDPPTPVYLVHRWNGGARGADFKILDTSGLVPVTQLVTVPFLMIGTFYTGASIAYTTCLVGDVVIATLTYWSVDDTPLTDCTRALEIVVNPTSPYGEPVVVDCNFALKPAYGPRFWFGPSECEQFCNPVTTRSSTWGSVKALYR